MEMHNRCLFFCLNPSIQAKNYIRSLPKVPKKDLNTFFFKASTEGKLFNSLAMFLSTLFCAHFGTSH